MTAANAWCRSVNSGNSSYFCLVGTNGNASDYATGYAYISYALAPGFCV